MTALEMKNEFNLFFNNINSASAMGIDDYELSVLFTTVEEQLVKELYSGDLSTQTFENTEEVRRYLDTILITRRYDESEVSSDVLLDELEDHNIYTLPTDLWYIVYEKARYESTSACVDGRYVDVYPATHDEYERVRHNPFRGPSDRRTVRLDKGGINCRQVEIIGAYPIQEYVIKYIAKPKPIIITELEGTDSIDGYTEQMDCELPQALHRTIVMRAVQLAASTIEGLIKRQQQ